MCRTKQREPDIWTVFGTFLLMLGGIPLIVAFVVIARLT